jgi:hypothetical protein
MPKFLKNVFHQLVGRSDRDYGRHRRSSFSSVSPTILELRHRSHSNGLFIQDLSESDSEEDADTEDNSEGLSEDISESESDNSLEDVRISDHPQT